MDHLTINTTIKKMHVEQCQGTRDTFPTQWEMCDIKHCLVLIKAFIMKALQNINEPVSQHKTKLNSSGPKAENI